MKAIVTLTAGLMILSTTFAQTSRRSEVKENNSETNNRRTEAVSTERRAPSDRSNNSRTTESNSTRRSSDTQATEKRAEVSSPARVNDNPPTERRTEVNSQKPSDRSDNSSTNRRTDNSSERRTQVTPSNPGTQQPSGQDRSSVTNRRNPSEQQRNNGYGNNNSNEHRRQAGGNRDQVIVHEHSNRKVERHHHVVHKSYRPVPVEVRRVKYPYRAPRTEIIWTVDLSRRYEVYYPAYRPYRYHAGMRLFTVSAYDAFDYVGEIARVYGRVSETYYSWDTDEYFLYIGDFYPYQDFTVVIPGREARDFARRPERFFEREYIEVTGLITRFEGKPEMIIKRSSQISVY